MPFPKSFQNKRKKKEGLLQRAMHAQDKFVRNALRDAEDIVTGVPSGIVAISHALDQALPASPIPKVDEDKFGRKHKRDSKQIKIIAKAIAEQTKEDLRHPLRNPVSTALTLGGIASLGTGTVARGAAGAGALSRGAGLKAAAKAAARPKPPVRTLRSIQKPTPVTGDRYKMMGKWIEKKPQKTGRKDYKLVANPNPLVRGARKITLDPLYERSAAKAAKNAANPRLVDNAKILEHGSKEYKKVTGEARTALGALRKARAAGYDAVRRGDRIQVVNKKALHPNQPMGGGYARMVERRTVDQRQRYAKQLREATNPTEERAVSRNLPRDLWRAPLDLMRMGMYIRPRYYVQNLGGTTALLAHQGVSAGDVKAVAAIRKSDPELYKLLVAAGGETGTSSISFGGHSSGAIGRAQSRMSNLANRPEAHMRTFAIYKAAKDFGLEDPATLKRVLSKPDSNEAQLIMQRGNEAVVDYSRYGGSGNLGQMEKSFVHSGIPIFYPMTKGFSRYLGRFPTQHPAQAGLLAQLGQEGKDFQRDNLGGEPQPWFPYITPGDEGTTQNLQNIYPYSPGADVLRQFAQTLPGAQRHPTLNLLQQLGPTGEFVGGALSGRQVATGFEYDEDTLDKYGSLLTALGDTVHSVAPFADLVSPRTSAAFGTPDLEERLKLWAVGPGFVKRKTNYSKVRQPKKTRRSGR